MALSRQNKWPQVFSLDLGTTKFCLAGLRPDATGSNPQVETLSVPAEGMKRGMLANLREAGQALQTLIDTAEDKWGCSIRSVVAGVAGSHLKSRMIHCSRTIGGRAVTEDDLAALTAEAEQSEAPSSREILHTVPAGYRIDARETIEDPVGFRAEVLHGDFFLIDADRYYLRDIIDLCNAAGLQVSRLYSEPFASTSVTVPDEHKNLGVALADIGGGTTDGIVFQSGRPRMAFTVNVAGKMMTQDLAIGLGLDPKTAEDVKICFGLDNTAKPQMDVKTLSGSAETIGPDQVLPILGPRVQELCAHLATQLRPFKGSLGGGLLLTGGGSNVKGLEALFHSLLKIPVRRIDPTLSSERLPVSATSQKPMETQHATALGLLNLELCRIYEGEKTTQSSWKTRYLGTFIDWLKELS